MTDQRVHRLAELLMVRGVEVKCIGRKLRNSPSLEEAKFKYRRYRMLITRGPLFYACFNVRLLLTLLVARGPSLFIANDLDTLPANFMAARIRRVKLIYDSHELFTQVPELIDRKMVQSIWKWIEYRYVPRVEYALTVNRSIAEIYRRLYKVKFRVVRNVPAHREPCMDQEFRAGFTNMQIILYQGALNLGRGLELMIETMNYLENAVFIIAGSGDIEKELHKMVSEKGLQDKVRFRGRLSPDRLFELTCSADLGISLEEDRGLNYRYALPNKIFDYIQARIPVLCSDLPEMARIIRTYGVGIATDEKEPEKLAGIIRFILKERAGGAWREGLDRAAADLCWENESRIYLEMLSDCGLW